MASTHSAINSIEKHDVFLSFRGTDTRDNFVSFLYRELVDRNGIETYIDNRLQGGEEIEPALLRKIEESLISLVILSKNYADSTFCLREFSKIIDCKETKGQIVIPIFYQVDPDDVGNLHGSFGDALRMHEQNCSLQISEEEREDRLQEVRKWRQALTEIANLKGWDSNVTTPETILIKEIVDDVKRKLEQMSLHGSPSGDSKHFVGIKSRVKDIESLLSFGSSGVLIVGIWGMAGIGKSTMAEAVYHQNSHKFEGCCFFRNVREESQKHGSPVHVQQEILREVLEKKDLSIRTKVLDPAIKRMLQRKKVFIVLDDVNSPRDLKDLVGEEGLLGQGSRIIVTSRDRQVLINKCEEDKIYEVKNLEEHDALQLLCLHAFKQNYPIEEYMQLSEKVLRYVKGIPLALEVLGCNLYKRNVEYWKGKLAQLENNGVKDVEKTLETCYHELDETAKKVFLDIACFFGMCKKDLVQQTLDPEERIGITRLTDMCLIKIADNHIWMHDVLQHLGREIVCQESIDDPGKRRSLWEPKDVYRVLTNHQGTGKVETISLDLSATKEMNLSPTAFKGMNNLRLLNFYNPPSPKKPMIQERVRIHLPQGLQFLPDELRILHWYSYPLKYLPSNFYPEKLVELEMPYSQLEQLWNEYQPLVNLKLMNLNCCMKLNLMNADFSKIPNLEVLNLAWCASLVEFPSSIKYCTKLTKLCLRGWKSLCTLPSSIEHLTQLVELDLFQCESLGSLPDSIGKLKRLAELNLHSCSRLASLPNSIGELKCLAELNLYSCSGLASLPNSIGKLKCLAKLNLGFCSKIESLPNSIGELECLATLNLYSCSKLASLPNSIGQLKSLAKLNLGLCSKLESLPNSIYDLESLEMLQVYSCYNLNGFPENRRSIKAEETPSSTNKLGRLRYLNLVESGMSEIPNSFGSLVSLRELILSGNDFKRIPANIKQLPNLTGLLLDNCKRLQCLPELPSSLHCLNVNNCFSLESVASIFTQGEKEYEASFEDFNFTRCKKLGHKERIKIMAGAWLRIRQMAISLFNQGSGGIYECRELVGFRLCIPGLDVPEWFRYKNAQGSSIENIKPPAHWNRSSTDQFLGFAFCAVVAYKGSAFTDYYSDRKPPFTFADLDIRCECHLIIEGERQRYFHFSFVGDIAPSLTPLESKHVFIWYDGYDWSAIKSNCFFKDLSFHFYPEIKYESGCGKTQSRDFCVLKCGIHPLFAQDDEPEQPHPKIDPYRPSSSSPRLQESKLLMLLCLMVLWAILSLMLSIMEHIDAVKNGTY